MTALPGTPAEPPQTAAVDFPTRPDLFGDPLADPAGSELPTRQSLGFAAAPVPIDYATPPVPADLTVHHEAPPAPVPPPAAAAAASPAAQAGAGEASTAGPGMGGSYIWDLAATDVFPVKDEPDMPPPAPGAVSSDDAPGASGG
jgi:hypothetical protein